MTDPRVLVIGCGSAGSRHARNLIRLGTASVTVFDSDVSRSQKLAGELEATAAATVEDALSDGCDAVVIATPPGTHRDALGLAVEAGCHVLVEKPIADAVDGIDQILAAARNRGLTVMAGYNLRFIPALRRLHELASTGALGRITTVTAEFGQYLPTWRPDADYRSNYIVSAGESGGIILEESHEFDYVKWIAGPVNTVYCASGQLSNLEMKTEDTALITMRHRNDALSSIHVDCVQRGYRRGARVVGTDGTAEWRFPGTIEIIDADGKSTTEDHQSEFAESYVEEMRTFLDCIDGKARPPVDGFEAIDTLRLALAARESAVTGSEVRA